MKKGLQEPVILHKGDYARFFVAPYRDDTPLCKIEVTLPGVWGHGGRTVAVLSMSKQEFSRLDRLLRVQSGGLRLHWALSIVRERYPDFSATPSCAGGLLVAEKLHNAARRLHALDIGEIEITDRSQRFRRGACLKILRQRIQPCPVIVALICAALGRRHLLTIDARL